MELLVPYRSAGQVEVLLRQRPVAAESDGDTVTAVTLSHQFTGEGKVINASYTVDATDLDDLMELAAVWSLNRGLTPRQERNTPEHLADFQRMLVEKLGFVLQWPAYAAITRQ